jgi:5-methylcytosine-specific restriction endonuclease McrA
MGMKKQRIPTHIRRQVIERDGLFCVYCDDDLTDQEVHLDHIVPESQGGATTYDNLQVTCRRCNTAKGILTEEEFVSKLRKRAQNILWRLGSG